MQNQNNIYVTIFTPTFNRSSTLERLYNSLLVQDCCSFEWLIVDDGSTDSTEDLINHFIQQNEGVLIRYHKQDNRGKHCAINKGISLAKGNFFFIVDSDDFLFPNSVSLIVKYAQSIYDLSNFAGVSGNRCYSNGNTIGGIREYSILDCNTLDFRYKSEYKGDMAEVYKTSILREYQFPEFKGEKFCPEALIWNRIAKAYKLRFFNKNIYCCEYLEDGLTSKISQLLRKNPNGSLMYYSELALNKKIVVFYRLRAAVNYYRFSYGNDIPIIQKIRSIGFFYSLLCFIPGYIAFIRDKNK